MKETFYFSHDYNSRSDEKIKPLIRKHGMSGYGVFWAIIEDLYNNANALRLDCESIAYDMRTDETVVNSIINDFDLFVIKDGYFGSLSIERRINEKNAKSKTARKSAVTRWEKYKSNANASILNANAMRHDEECNAIKERKGKEIKEIKGNKERDNKTLSLFEIFLTENQIKNPDALEFLNSESWFESKAMQLKSETDILTEKAKDFLVNLRHRDELEGKQLPDLRSHFINWFKIKRESVNPDKPVTYRIPKCLQQ